MGDDYSVERTRTISIEKDEESVGQIFGEGERERDEQLSCVDKTRSPGRWKRTRELPLGW